MIDHDEDEKKPNIIERKTSEIKNVVSVAILAFIGASVLKPIFGDLLKGTSAIWAGPNIVNSSKQ